MLFIIFRFIFPYLNFFFQFFLYFSRAIILFKIGCKTPDNKDGTCIPAINCRFIYDLIRNRTISKEEIRQTLAPYKCENSKACCPLEGLPSHPSRINAGKNKGFFVVFF